MVCWSFDMHVGDTRRKLGNDNSENFETLCHMIGIESKIEPDLEFRRSLVNM